MRPLMTIVSAAALATVSATSAAQSVRPPLRPQPEPVVRTAAAAATAGRIAGRVTDDRDAPLPGAVVSVLGASVTFAVTDPRGQFALGELPPGAYIVRAHLEGFAASRRELVHLSAGGAATHTFRLTRSDGRPILAAGLGSVSSTAAPPGEPDAGTAAVEGDHDHGETVWRLRHLKRSVLKETGDRITMAAAAQAFEPSAGASFLSRAVESSARFAASLITDFPFSGQVNLLTSAVLDAPQGLVGGSRVPRGIAYVSIGAPGGRGDWRVQGAMSEGDVASWVVAGSYRRAPGTNHAFDVGLSYGTQRYDGGNPSALAAVTEGARNVGTVHVSDRWIVAPRAVLEYGGRYAWYDYLDDRVLFSPDVAVTLTPFARTHVRVGAAQRVLAPGAEEFMPPPSYGMWLPPERTFAPLAADRPFRAERARQLDVSVEQEIGATLTIGVHRFYQAVDDQLATIFGASGAGGALGHYYVASAGNVTADGWGLSLNRAMAHRLRGSVEYSVTRARWAHSPEAALIARWAASAVRPDNERIHDVTAVLESEVPETATRVYFVYKINSAFSQLIGDEISPWGRFDIQLNQGLPFAVRGSQWEVLVAVRSLFRDPLGAASVYDELLVVRPPKRVVGGVLVKF